MTDVLTKPWLDRSWILDARPRDASTGFFGVVEFDGTGEGDFGDILDQTTGSFSIQIRIKRTSVGTFERVFCRRDGELLADIGYCGFVKTDNGYRAQISDGIADPTVVSASSISMTTFETYTTVVDRDNDLLLLYREDTLEDTVSIAGLGSLSNAQNFYLGRNGSGPDTPTVILGELRFWSVALTAAEVADNYAGELDTNNLPDGLELYWRMREGSGTVATDETTNSFNGTLLDPIWGIPGDPPVLLDVRLSSDGRRNFPTDAEEVQYRAGLKGPFLYGSSIKGLWGFAGSRVGQITIGDGDGVFRSLAREDWISREMEVRVGRRDAPLADFDVAALLLSRQIRYNRDSLAIVSDDHSYIFRLPIQSNFYAGTGGLEGTLSMVNYPKPLAFGASFRVQPVLVDPSLLIYQFHDGSMESINDVLSGWQTEFTFQSDVADITAGNVPASKFNTSLATGFIRFGSIPSGIITANIEGFNTGGYVDALPDLLTLMAVTFAGLDPGDVDVSGVVDYTAPMGIYVAEEEVSVRPLLRIAALDPVEVAVDRGANERKRTTILGAIEAFCNAGLAWSRMTPTKKFIAGRIVDPNSETSDYTVTEDETRNAPWDSIPFEIPVGRVFVGYQRYYETIPVGSAQRISPAGINDWPDLARDYRFVQAENLGLFMLVPEARDIVVLTNLALEVDAQQLADEQLALREVLRETLTTSTRTGLTDRGVGDVVRVVDGRLPGGPRQFVVTGAEATAGNGKRPDSVVLKLFG